MLVESRCVFRVEVSGRQRHAWMKISNVVTPQPLWQLLLRPAEWLRQEQHLDHGDLDPVVVVEVSSSQATGQQ